MPTNTQGVLRARPRVNVTRGYPGNEADAITASLLLNSSSTTIYSGQAMERLSTDKFDLADENTAATSVYIAYHDSTDTDVTSGGKLLGFAAIGVFEIESAYVSLDGLSVGDALAVNDSGDLVKQGLGTTGSTIGYVTEIRDLGVGGHTAIAYGTNYGGNARGGVAGTIPEDSTSDTYAADSDAYATAQISIIDSQVTDDDIFHVTDALGVNLGFKFNTGANTNDGTNDGADPRVVTIGIQDASGSDSTAHRTDVADKIAAAINLQAADNDTTTQLLGITATVVDAVTTGPAYVNLVMDVAGTDGNTDIDDTVITGGLWTINDLATDTTFGASGGTAGSDAAIKIVKFVTSV